MAKRLIPLLDRVLVEKLAPPTKTVGGVLLPETASKMSEGRVVAVGPGRRSLNGDVIPVSVKAGDTVLLPDFGGTNVKLDSGSEFALYRDDELLGVLTS
ncbi:hypothetical protein WJX81_004199 [Elliptochloris bilobata]|uniref:Protein groES n=1 Tax=Elliptochloris bilobata TaxID=381761 RepID=A0AAW1S0T3_9CHLO